MAAPDRPFAGRKLTRKERRAAEKRAKARADALAKAMPPPSTTDRVDPVTGRPVYAPGQATPLAPTSPRQASTAPAPAAAATRGRSPRAQPKPPGQASAAATAHESPEPGPETGSGGRGRQPRRRRSGKRLAGTAAQVPSWDESAYGDPGRRWTPRRLLTPVGEDQAAVNLVAGLTLVTFGFMVTVAFGLPVLNHGWQPQPLAGGLLLLAVGSAMVARGWRHSRPRATVPAVAVAALLVSSFGVGVAADPVVIDGRVLLNTSTEARSARLLGEVYTDLRQMADLDVLLAADITDARARVSEFDPAVHALTELATEYSTMDATSLPDPAFVDLVSSMKTAAHWQSEAMKSKRQLVRQDDSKTAADLATQRAAFTEAWLTASAQLQDVAFALNIPVEDHLKGPHE